MTGADDMKATNAARSTNSRAPTITVLVRAISGREQAFRDAFANLATYVHENEPGTLDFYVSQGEDPRVFTTYERFVDQAAMEVHNRSETLQRFRDTVTPWVDGEFTLVKGTEFKARGSESGSTAAMEDLNKQIVGRWFKEFWGNPWNPQVVDDLAAPDMLFDYPMHGPRKGSATIKKMMTEFRVAFPDLNFWGVGDLIADGEYVVGRWDGGGTHTGPAFTDLLVGSLPEASGKTMRFTGTTVFRLKDGKILEEIGEEGAYNALTQLGLIKAA